MDYLSKYYELSQEVKEVLANSDLSDKQKKQARKITDAFEAAEKSFLHFTQTITQLNDAIAWHKSLSKKSESNYSDYWRQRFYKLKQFATGQTELNRETIDMLK